MAPTFPVHGKAHTVVTGQLVRLYVEGPWNMELVSEVHQALIGLREQYRDQPWGMMVITQRSSLCGPDAMEAIRQAATRETQHSGRRATAWVLAPDVEGSAIMTVAVRKIYAGIHTMQTFDNEAEAERWLIEQISAAG